MLSFLTRKTRGKLRSSERVGIFCSRLDTRRVTVNVLWGNNKCWRKPKGQLWMDNSEIVTTLATKDTRRRQKQQTNKQINNHSSRKSKKDRQYNRQANICATFWSLSIVLFFSNSCNSLSIMFILLSADNISGSHPKREPSMLSLIDNCA